MSPDEVVAMIVASSLVMFMAIALGGMIADKAGAAVGALIGALLVTALVYAANHERRRNAAAFLASEINDEDYRNLASWKGVDCALDRIMAKAMVDGKVTEGEAEPMWARQREIYRAQSRALLGGIDPSATCRTTPVKA